MVSLLSNSFFAQDGVSISRVYSHIGFIGIIRVLQRGLKENRVIIDNFGASSADFRTTRIKSTGKNRKGLKPGSSIR